MLARFLTPKRNNIIKFITNRRLYSSYDFNKGLPPKVLNPSTLSRFDLFNSTDPSTRFISAVYNNGFLFSNDLRLNGPVFVINGEIFMWDVLQYGVGSLKEVELEADAFATTSIEGSNDKNSTMHIDPASPFHGWTKQTFEILELLDILPEILVIGTGSQTAQLPAFLKEYINSFGIQTEVMGTKYAGATYNMLLKEGRKAAAALLPNIPTSARTGFPLVKFTTTNPDERS
ncbi:hypothetical protein HK098_007515 [Nowakowskiella sp. JEL0407]|nr:hypothetical protein HK098_007515 [Nowakowskiella sp. JEL0407]